MCGHQGPSLQSLASCTQNSVNIWSLPWWMSRENDLCTEDWLAELSPPSSTSPVRWTVHFPSWTRQQGEVEGSWLTPSVMSTLVTCILWCPHWSHASWDVHTGHMPPVMSILVTRVLWCSPLLTCILWCPHWSHAADTETVGVEDTAAHICIS